MSNIKKYLEFYYGIKYLEELREEKNVISFFLNNSLYYFMPTYISEEELVSINNVIITRPIYDALIKNRYKKIITIINNTNYVLIKKSKNIYSVEDIILSNRQIFYSQINNYVIKINWPYLWSKKIDYIINQFSSYKKQHHLNQDIVYATWYFVGMAETAISYVYPIINNNDNKNLYISHRRIKESHFNSPLNIIVDYKERDISEYLKYLFISNNYNYKKIEKFIDKLGINNNSNSAELIYGRMLFPTEYFDQLDKYLNDNSNDILSIIKRIEEYEEYLSNIYIILSKKNKVKEIEWI